MSDWLTAAQLKLKRMKEEDKAARQIVTDNLYSFACLMNPSYQYGDIHKQIFKWMEDYSLFGKLFHKELKGMLDGDLPDSKLIMLPRGHLKSHMIAVWCAWMIVRHPEVTILYLSATASLAEKQLYAIKNILTSSMFKRLFPEYICPVEGHREKWTESVIIIDHPLRKELGVRDATIATAGLTTGTTGWHADVVAVDDVVTPENAYTEDGRSSVSKKVAQFSSIMNAGGFLMAAGTRYHPRDEYATWKNQVYEVFNEEGELLGTKASWTIKEYVVEEDGTFLWPRVAAPNGKMYGFNANVLSKIRSGYNSDLSQFYSQYYNNPNAAELNSINRDSFQYYDPKFIKNVEGIWYFKESRLNVYAAVDFAYSLGKRSDYTSIAVIGIDHDDNVYVLDIDRFKTKQIKVYFDHILSLHSKWEFRKLRAEVSVAQAVIVSELKDEIRRKGMRLSVDEFRPSRKEGSKEERIGAILDHRYADLRVWHRRDGLTPVLEEELVMINPPHDDIKDALASAVDIAVKPQRSSLREKPKAYKNHVRFGGIR